MIFYFSGTGNSKWVASELGVALNEPLISIAEELEKGRKEFVCSSRTDEKILFVYPVHSWGPAALVMRFIADMVLIDYSNQPIYSVCTCGDEAGYTGKLLQKTLWKKDLSLTGSYSVIMPNNYILLPGFNIDSKEVEKEKLQDAPSCVAAIAEAIRWKQAVRLYKTGSLPYLKSYWIYPLFISWGLRINHFRVTDVCISCGLCERVCPTATIRLVAGKPEWDTTCVQCVACIHCCPVHAIEYGKITVKKGRYHHPDV